MPTEFKKSGFNFAKDELSQILNNFFFSRAPDVTDLIDLSEEISKIDEVQAAYSNPQDYADYVVADFMECSSRFARPDNNVEFYSENHKGNFMKSLPDKVQASLWNYASKHIQNFEVSSSMYKRNLAGLFYMHGIGTLVNLGQARKLFFEAKSRGIELVSSQLNYGDCFMEIVKAYKGNSKLNKNTISDIAQAALREYQETEKKHYPPAFYKMGECLGGKVWPFKAGDPAVSFKYYKMAAIAGFSAAQFEVAQHYINAVGVERDYNKAFKYLILACNDNNAKAIDFLSQLSELNMQRSGRNIFNKFLREPRNKHDVITAIEVISRHPKTANSLLNLQPDIMHQFVTEHKESLSKQDLLRIQTALVTAFEHQVNEKFEKSQELRAAEMNFVNSAEFDSYLANEFKSSMAFFEERQRFKNLPKFSDDSWWFPKTDFQNSPEFADYMKRYDLKNPNEVTLKPSEMKEFDDYLNRKFTESQSCYEAQESFGNSDEIKNRVRAKFKNSEIFKNYPKERFENSQLGEMIQRLIDERQQAGNVMIADVVAAELNPAAAFKLLINACKRRDPQALELLGREDLLYQYRFDPNPINIESGSLSKRDLLKAINVMGHYAVTVPRLLTGSSDLLAKYIQGNARDLSEPDLLNIDAAIFKEFERRGVGERYEDSKSAEAVRFSLMEKDLTEVFKILISECEKDNAWAIGFLGKGNSTGYRFDLDIAHIEPNSFGKEGLVKAIKAMGRNEATAVRLVASSLLGKFIKANKENLSLQDLQEIEETFLQQFEDKGVTKKDQDNSVTMRVIDECRKSKLEHLPPPMEVELPVSPITLLPPGPNNEDLVRPFRTPPSSAKKKTPSKSAIVHEENLSRPPSESSIKNPVLGTHLDSKSRSGKSQKK